MNTWDEFIEAQFQEDYFKDIDKFLSKEAKEHTIFPAKDNVFKAFAYTPLSDVRCVILGLDPYINTYLSKKTGKLEPQATGLSFSVPEDCPLPPSLKNIFAEMQNDIGLSSNDLKHGSLVGWAKNQGCLMLNSFLSVRQGETGSHRCWAPFTDEAISLLESQERPIAYLLMGSAAQEKRKLITNKMSKVVAVAHPSPRSAHRGFFGSKPFSQINTFLTKNKIEPIDWRVI